MFSSDQVWGGPLSTEGYETECFTDAMGNEHVEYLQPMPQPTLRRMQNGPSMQGTSLRLQQMVGERTWARKTDSIPCDEPFESDRGRVHPEDANARLASHHMRMVERNRTGTQEMREMDATGNGRDALHDGYNVLHRPSAYVPPTRRGKMEAFVADPSAQVRTNTFAGSARHGSASVAPRRYDASVVDDAAHRGGTTGDVVRSVVMGQKYSMRHSGAFARNDANAARRRIGSDARTMIPHAASGFRPEGPALEHAQRRVAQTARGAARTTRIEVVREDAIRRGDALGTVGQYPSTRAAAVAPGHVTLGSFDAVAGNDAVPQSASLQASASRAHALFGTGNNMASRDAPVVQTAWVEAGLQGAHPQPNRADAYSSANPVANASLMLGGGKRAVAKRTRDMNNGIAEGSHAALPYAPLSTAVSHFFQGAARIVTGREFKGGQGMTAMAVDARAATATRTMRSSSTTDDAVFNHMTSQTAGVAANVAARVPSRPFASGGARAVHHPSIREPTSIIEAPSKSTESRYNPNDDTYRRRAPLASGAAQTASHAPLIVPLRSKSHLASVGAATFASRSAPSTAKIREPRYWEAKHVS